MQKMLKHIFPPEFFSDHAYFRAFVLGVLYVGLAIAQLFTFEKFAGVVAGFNIAGGIVTANLLAIIIPLVEIAALPFLISVTMSSGRLWRVARGSVLIAPVLWFVLSVWQNVSSLADKTNSGILGATIPTGVGIWFIAFTLLWFWAALLVVRELPHFHARA